MTETITEIIIRISITLLWTDKLIFVVLYILVYLNTANKANKGPTCYLKKNSLMMKIFSSKNEKRNTYNNIIFEQYNNDNLQCSLLMRKQMHTKKCNFIKCCFIF